MSQPPGILLDTQANTATADPAIHRFGRRWEATFLALLAARQVTHEALTNELTRRGQRQPLNRSQMQRLLDSLRAYLDALPGRPLSIEHPPRKATTGPWQLRYRQAFDIAIDPGSSGNAAQDTGAIGPRLLQSTCLTTWRHLLETLLVADGFAAQGKYIEAVESLAPAHDLPLTADARFLLHLRTVRHENILGNHAEARCLLVRLLQEHDAATLVDPGLLPYARFLLDRIDYDHAPGVNYPRLWAMGEPLVSGVAAHPLHAGEWHNLRALLARRMLHESAATSGQVDERTRAFHRTALAHLESAMYWALGLRNWERLQAFVANLAYHLQSVIPLGLATPLETYAWHSLEHAYYDKLDAGKESAWELIYLGQFWLDYEADLAGGMPVTAVIGDHHPDEEAFYLHAIRSVEQTGDARQAALGWINYRRFAARHLGPEKLLNADRALSRLFAAHDELRTTLEAEGYARHLPPNA